MSRRRVERGRRSGGGVWCRREEGGTAGKRRANTETVRIVARTAVGTGLEFAARRAAATTTCTGTDFIMVSKTAASNIPARPWPGILMLFISRPPTPMPARTELPHTTTADAYTVHYIPSTCTVHRTQCNALPSGVFRNCLGGGCMCLSRSTQEEPHAPHNIFLNYNNVLKIHLYDF